MWPEIVSMFQTMHVLFDWSESTHQFSTMTLNIIKNGFPDAEFVVLKFVALFKV